MCCGCGRLCNTGLWEVFSEKVRGIRKADFALAIIMIRKLIQLPNGGVGTLKLRYIIVVR